MLKRLGTILAVTYGDYKASDAGIYRLPEMKLHNVGLGVYTIVRNVAGFCAVIGMVVAAVIFIYAALGDNKAMAESKRHVYRTIALIIFLFGCASLVAFLVTAFGMDSRMSTWVG